MCLQFNLGSCCLSLSSDLSMFFAKHFYPGRSHFVPGHTTLLMAFQIGIQRVPEGHKAYSICLKVKSHFLGGWLRLYQVTAACSRAVVLHSLLNPENKLCFNGASLTSQLDTFITFCHLHTITTQGNLNQLIKLTSNLGDGIDDVIKHCKSKNVRHKIHENTFITNTKVSDLFWTVRQYLVLKCQTQMCPFLCRHWAWPCKHHDLFWRTGKTRIIAPIKGCNMQILTHTNKCKIIINLLEN